MNFNRWEQAFRTYSKMYLHAYPHKATELLQYNHVIFTASLSYAWETVYTYDKEFHNHLASFPGRSWGIILQQACLKDRVNHYNSFGGGNKFGSSTPKNRTEACKRFNKGLCTAGRACKYDHHCLECGKFGHGAHNCHKRLNQGGQNSQAQTVGSSLATTSMPGSGTNVNK